MPESVSRVMFLANVKTQALNYAPLASVFKEGDKKLIPIIFSHGLVSSRGTQTATATELASHGYVVFVPDH